MAKLTCAYSGIRFDVQYFSNITLHSREACHPIFLIPSSKLPSYYNNWADGKLDATESYLLFLALLKATNLVEFRVPACRTDSTASLIASYLPQLLKTSNLIEGIKHPSFSVPTICITPDTNDLSNIKYWLQTWNTAYEDFLTGLRNDELRSKLARREAALEKLIKSPQIAPQKYAVLLSQWASEAGNFPTFNTRIASGQVLPIDEYWRDIIVRCYRTESMLSIPEEDLRELMQHCEDNIDIGTIFSHHLFATLEEGLSRIRSFFGESFSSLSSDNPGYRILNNVSIGGAAANLEAVNLAILVDTAPLQKPERQNFASDFLFLKAKSKWDLAQQYIPASSLATSDKESI